MPSKLTSGGKVISNKYVTYGELIQSKSEINRMVSMANKRLARLEKGGLQDSPAYKKLVGDNGQFRFSVRGKTHNELQKEVAKLVNFVNSETSTIRGINNNLKEIANNTGIEYKNLKELRQKAGKFFELSSKVEQYLRSVNDVASAIGYQKIWEAINTYVKNEGTNLEDANNDLDSVIKIVDTLIEAPNNVDDKGSDLWWFVE